MKVKSVKKLVLENIFLLVPLIIYGIYKNGYLIYEKGYISLVNIFKPLFLVIIALIIKLIIDLVKYKKINIDYNLVYAILIAMIMPYNVNWLVFIIGFTISYLLSLFLEKYFKFNKVCFIYLIIILINGLLNEFSFANILEAKYNYSFSFWDLLIGRNIGGISSSSIFFSLLAYIILCYNFYYKKDIPLFINISYLLLAIIYFIFTHNNNFLLNSELIFGSIFVASLPEFSPVKRNKIIFYSIVIGIISFGLTIFISSPISIYLAIFIVSLFLNIRLDKKQQNKS